jgi:hypothetical protein
LRELDEEDAREAAEAKAWLAQRFTLPTISEDSVDLAACGTPGRRARFADVVEVEVHTYEEESEDEQSLEDYFGDWSALDKATILSEKSILEVDVSQFYP